MMSNSKGHLVTIICAIYNGEKFLPLCIESMMKQTYKNIEIILVDDGSTDKCSEICDEYQKKDKRIKVIHKENGGVCSARNVGLKNAAGDFICIVDQDDLLSDCYVEYLLELNIKNNTPVSVVPKVVYYMENQQKYEEKKDSSVVEVWSGEKAACEMLCSKMEIGPWSKMISKELIDNNKISFDENLFGGEGYLFSIDVFVCSDYVSVGYKGVYNYRVDNYNSEMSKFRVRTYNSSLRAVKIMEKRYAKKSEKLKKAIKYAYWRVYVSFLNSMIASSSMKKNPEIYRELVLNCRKYAWVSFGAMVPLKRKIKDMLYFLSPTLVAKVNVLKNKKRKLVKES